MCNRDCFNCVHDDCITDSVSWDDYCEIESRNKKKYCESDKGQWNARHPNKIKEYKRKYHEKNKEAENAKAREYYYANRDSILERNKLDYVREYKREWARKHRQKLNA